MSESRTIIWFSCGAASTIAAYLTLQDTPGAELVYCDTGGENPDNVRFLSDVEKWLNKRAIILRHNKYTDHMDVVEKRRFINSPKGALCTAELKIKLRLKYQQPGDIQVFGYTVDETARAESFQRSFPDVDCEFPLIINGLTKADCLQRIRAEGIDIPMMYKLGFSNNNCIGCVKGGMGYWNHIRKHFPERYKRMAEIERKIGRTCIKGMPLDQLAPGKGRMKPIACGFDCPIERE